MARAKSRSLYLDTPSIPSGERGRDIEKRTVSYWLEKLHVQRDQIKTGEAEKEILSKINDREVLKKLQSPDKNQHELAQSGINENTKNAATKKEEDLQTIDDLVKKSNRRITTITSIFPWDFFPSTIDVEESRITFKFNQFLSSQSHSVDLKDISNVFIEFSMFFATLQVVSRTFVQNDIKVGFLNKEKARKVQGIIEGLRTLAEHDVNTSDYEIDELIAKIGEFHANKES